MKNTFFLLLLLLSCQNDTRFTPTIHQGVFVKAHVNIPDKTSVYLQEKTADKYYKTIQTTQVSNHSFSFSENILEPKLYYIGFDYTDKKIPFIANKYDTFIHMENDHVEDAKIEGTKILHDYYAFKADLDKIKNQFAFKMTYIKEHPNSILSAIILKDMLGKSAWRLSQNKKAYNYLSDEVKTSHIGLDINHFIEDINITKTNTNNKVIKTTKTAKKQTDLEINTSETPKPEEDHITETKEPQTSNLKGIPNFYAESIKGNDISLNSIRQNKTVVLVDFWASWCTPCRAQNPHLKRLYDKYHASGFDIIGVSEDRYRDLEKWKNAVATDHLTWHQVIDDNKRVAKMFGVTTIPHAVLIDRQGNIILDKASSHTIEQQLLEIFGF